MTKKMMYFFTTLLLIISNAIIAEAVLWVQLPSALMFQAILFITTIVVAFLLLKPDVMNNHRYFLLFATPLSILFQTQIILYLRSKNVQDSFFSLLIIIALLVGSTFLCVSGIKIFNFTIQFWIPLRKYIIFAGAVGCGLIVNALLLIFFNTLLWPYLWPAPLGYILIGLIVGVFCFPNYLRRVRLIRVVGISMLFVGECYLLHAYSIMLEDFSILSLMHSIGFTGMYFAVLLNVINQSNPRPTIASPTLDLDRLPYVVAVIPTYGEPVDILEKTIYSLLNLNYAQNRFAVLISDDGHRAEVKALAKELNIHYNYGARKDAKAGNLNSALTYIEENFSDVELILTQDADEILHPDFLLKTVGYFQHNPKLGLVQTPKEAAAPHNDPFGTRDRIFYDVTQVGRNGYGSAFACGSAVVWRITALNKINGFATWNVVEDLTTSYFLHAAGYSSEYHNEVLSIGLSPEDIPGLLKQRGTWAVDNWRLFMFDNPLLKKSNLTWAQRLQYFELGIFHITTAFFTPMIALVPVISIFTGNYLQIEGAALFPWIAFTSAYYLVLGRGNVMHVVRMWQFWVGHGPTFIQAFWIALRSRHKKPSYVVTRKTRLNGFYGRMLWMQFFYLALVASALLYLIVYPPKASVSIVLSNVGTMLFFAYMVSALCRASFYRVSMTLPRLLPRFIRSKSIPQNSSL